jgi:type 1 glutamine amidotransferase/nicotinamidase-related amidase
MRVLVPGSIPGILLTGMLAIAGLAAPASAAEDASALALRLRSRTPAAEIDGRYRVVETAATWNLKETAVIVCDMWDLHHCLNAVRRAKEMAPRMDQVLKAMRDRGALIVHAPSSCMDAYKNRPGRYQAIATPRSRSLPKDIGQWCNQIPSEEKGAYPIDQSDGGEDDDPAEHREWAAKLTAMGRDSKAPWKSQTDLLTITDADVISDSGEEIWSVFAARRIKNVILVGVHLNMCVLGRPFGLRQMAKNRKNVVLMRDMTDTMYNPERRPYVSHFAGTDLMIEHVEKFVCPTITSDQVLGGTPFRFSGDKRPYLALLIAEDEYKTEISLPEFASDHLTRDYALDYVFADATDRNHLPSIGVLAKADAALVSVRRRVLRTDEVEALRKFVAAGKPIIGIRTASHAFAPRRDEAVPPGHEAWTTFDADVLGGNYQGHHPEGTKVAVSAAPGATDHPILRGIDPAKLVGHGSLYKVSPLARSATPLLLGTISGHPTEPIAWTNAPATHGRVFYTSLGHIDDFKTNEFQRLLRNSIDWATGFQPTDTKGRTAVSTTKTLTSP